MWPAIAAAIASATGRPFAVERHAPVSGGCINSAYRIEGCGAVYFVKIGSGEKRDMFAAEAAALEELARTATMRVPRAICHASDGAKSWLVLEYIALARHGDFSAFGQQLAALHRCTSSTFGWWRENALGATPQINTPAADWIDFWSEHRLGFQLRLALENGYRGRLQSAGERLRAALPALLRGHRPAPSLLHGDLWSGNVAFDDAGQPVIFDPAVYYGDRETDLAMTELFGRLPGEFYAAYDESFPLADGYAVRRDLYNLYHVLNHLNLFGGAYLAHAERLMAGLLARA